ncbi:hypothetical protein PsorP6_001046 [Peronosclerospora sorghi]|uniref:Uncharacterized protein n=1 Tax=Peronosclerospora sorghi TaxID=230839 RepID=A0ACC0WPD1_9STRA|nr:hypothetical protein PsorP6_001046 [Peronosclerospora sorghi]
METLPIDSYPSLAKPKIAINEFSHSKGFTVTRLRSKKDKSGLTKKVWLGCAHAGKYRNWREYLTEETRKRKNFNRRSGCPWQETIHRQVLVKSSDSKTAEVEVDVGEENVPLVGEQEWKIVIENPEHNHDVSKDLSAYPKARKLYEANRQTIKNMTSAGETPKVVLAALRQKMTDLPLVLEDIYNEKSRLRNEKLYVRIPLEVLFDDLHSAHIPHEYRRDLEGRITHLFFAPPPALELAREFPHVVLMDSTFLRTEMEDDYQWSITEIKKFLPAERLPKVVVTDWDLALMAAICVQMPDAHNILCSWHINKNVLANLRKHFESM